MNSTYSAHLVGIKDVVDCKNTQGGKLQNFVYSYQRDKHDRRNCNCIWIFHPNKDFEKKSPLNKLYWTSIRRA